MGETPKFFFLVAVATVLVSTFVLTNRSVEKARGIARGFYRVCIVLSAAALLLSVLSPFNLLHGELYARVFRILIFRGWIVVGAALSAAAFVLLNSGRPPNSSAGTPAIREFATSHHLLNGICISVAVSFICTEIGKLTHGAEMRDFFLQSGYAVWFLYFVITCETISSIGLLIQRARVLAAAGLSILMMGAIRTHAHNGDPFSDSLEALHLLIQLACIIVICVLGSRIGAYVGEKRAVANI